MRRVVLFVLLAFFSHAHAIERNPEWTQKCLSENQPRTDIQEQLIVNFIKSSCGERIYGEEEKDRIFGACMLARLTVAVTELDLKDAIMFCRTTNGWE